MAKKKQTKRTLTNLNIADIVDSEGLGYAITDYMGSKEFIDLELATLWDQAKVVLKQIQAKLDKAVDEDVGDSLG